MRVYYYWSAFYYSVRLPWIPPSLVDRGGRAEALFESTLRFEKASNVYFVGIVLSFKEKRGGGKGEGTRQQHCGVARAVLEFTEANLVTFTIMI